MLGACSVATLSQNNRGLSLVELFSAVAIIAILSALAVPIYRHFIAKAKMAEGEAAVMEVHGLVQQYANGTHTYTADLSVLGYSPTPPLKYYEAEVRLGDPKEATDIEYQVVALAKIPELDDWYLSVQADGKQDLWHEPPENLPASSSPSGASAPSASPSDAAPAASTPPSAPTASVPADSGDSSPPAGSSGSTPAVPSASGGGASSSSGTGDSEASPPPKKSKKSKKPKKKKND